jgi:glucose uptake protein GlcU
MTETTDGRAGVARTIIGLVLIVGAAPLYLGLSPGHQGWAVILGGLAALAVLVAGIVLAGRWLGVFQRRRENPREQQQGCLQLLVTLLALLAGAAILYYMMYYGAGAYLRGEVGLLLP